MKETWCQDPDHKCMFRPREILLCFKHLCVVWSQSAARLFQVEMKCAIGLRCLRGISFAAIEPGLGNVSIPTPPHSAPMHLPNERRMQPTLHMRHQPQTQLSTELSRTRTSLLLPCIVMSHSYPLAQSGNTAKSRLLISSSKKS